ncbi:thiamine phosphate synthase [Anaerosporobacter sp.]|uniref:thiamine phosphate synthase n=1 Tax=Anaerosporobacter sp. TaxID=1872529 RepID=UPI00286F5ED8|nr:thiamine phosphate synthase [Anaerosporobacter sp.]
MYKIFAITNRKLCKGDFLEQIEKIARSEIDSIVLREKDLTEEEYEELAVRVIEICNSYKKRCILHTYVDVAKKLKHDSIHLPLAIAKERQEDCKQFKMLGISTHSVEEAMEAQNIGATYITAGHIYATDCKKRLSPRGTQYLKQVCETVTVTVYGIGGITMENAVEVIAQGAEGICMMSSFMNGEICLRMNGEI